MPAVKTGDKGPALEELLKAYFIKSGYFVVRSVPFQLEGDDVTDIDLWLYERPSASTRRRIIIDVKNRKSPKAAERIIWTRGLQFALGVDTAMVATVDKSPSNRRLSKSVGIILLDGDAITKIRESEQLRSTISLRYEELVEQLKATDKTRRSTDWRRAYDDALASLSTGFGVQSANRGLKALGFFAGEAVGSQPGSAVATLAVRMTYFVASLAAISLDYIQSEHAFRSPEERRAVVIEGIRFGGSDAMPVTSIVRNALNLVRQYAENGSVVAKHVERAFFDDAAGIPAEVVADFVSKPSVRDTLFSNARELEAASFSQAYVSFDALSVDAKALLGVLLDFNGIQRQGFALANGGTTTSRPAPVSATPQERKRAGRLFDDRQGS